MDQAQSSWPLALTMGAILVIATACGDETTGSGTGPIGDAGSGGQAGGAADAGPAALPCPPGQLPLDDETCQAQATIEAVTVRDTKTEPGTGFYGDGIAVSGYALAFNEAPASAVIRRTAVHDSPRAGVSCCPLVLMRKATRHPPRTGTHWSFGPAVW